MPQFKSAALLNNADVAVSVGDRSQEKRSVAKLLAATALIFAATSFTSAQAGQRGASFEGQSDQQVLTISPDQVTGEVVSVRQINARNRSHRGEISPRSIAGALIGGAIGNQFGGGDGKKLLTLGGALAGGSIANRLADRRTGANREQYRNAREVEDNELVTVRVADGGSYRTYEIVQPAGFDLRRGDAVALMTSQDGKTLVAMPIAYEPTEEDRPERRSRRNPR